MLFRHAIAGLARRSVSAAWDQDSYRFYLDDGSPSASTAAAALNTGISIGLNSPRQVRFLIQETANSTGGEQPYFELAYRIDKGSGFSSWTQVGTTFFNDDPIRVFASTHITNGAHITQRIGSGTFRDGVSLDDTRFTFSPGATLAATQGLDEYEIHIAFTLDSTSSGTNAPAASGDVIQLRLEYNYDEVWRGDPLESYTNYPQITVT